MEFVLFALQGLSILVLVDVIASWLVGPDQFPRSLTAPITEPLYAPFRAILPPEKMGGLDLSPIGVFFAIRAVSHLLLQSGFNF